jgi:hypothetical protein
MATDNHFGLAQIVAWKEGDVSYYLHGSPPGPGGRVIVLTAVGPDDEHRWVVLPQGKAEEAATKWEVASNTERTLMAEALLPRGRLA